jgi:Tol biopolymer transport system component
MRHILEGNSMGAFSLATWKKLLCLPALMLAGVCLSAPQAEAAAPFRITYIDAPGTGFLEPRNNLGNRRRAAFEAAVGYWARRLTGTVSIEVQASFSSALPDGALAGAGPTQYLINTAGLPVRDSYYPAALGNQYARVDLIAGPEIDAVFNALVDSNTDATGPVNWYYGLDRNPPVVGFNSDGTPITDYDFYTVALHELGHGLGFSGLLQPGGDFFGGFPSVYDRYLTSGLSPSSTRLVSQDPATRSAALISNRLYFSGPSARRAENNGVNTKLYAPPSYEDGSTLSHLDEQVYSGLNQLMTPIYTDPAHELGPVGSGVMSDIGWGITPSVTATPVVPVTTPTTTTASGKVVFSSNRDGNYEIYIMNASGGVATRLTENSAADTQPVLNTRGDKIVFVSNRSGRNAIYMMSANGSGTPVQLAAGSGNDSEPAFSNDGTLILFTSDRDGNNEIYSIPSNATTSTVPTRLTNDPGSDTDPTFRPGQATPQIAFMSTRAGKPGIYLLTLAGNTPPQSFVQDVDAKQLTWNRDGTKLAFTFGSNIWVYVFTTATGPGGSTTTVTVEQVSRGINSNSSSPSFSPNSDRLVFQTDLFGQNEIGSGLLDGSDLVRLTTNPASDETPSWGGAFAFPATPTPTATPDPNATATPTTTPVPTATPRNNNIIDATELLGTTSPLTQSTRNASKEASEPNHAGNAGGASVWFSWTAAANESVSLETTGSSYDTVMAVYTGTNMLNLVQVAANDDAAGGTGGASRVVFRATQGTRYLIAVDGFGGAVGTLRLTWTTITGPPNDAFANAFTITGSSGALAGTDPRTNVNATKQAGEPNHALSAGGASVWYRWVAPLNAPVTFTTAGSNFDTLLAAYTGTSVGALTRVASNDDASTSTNTSSIIFTPVAGTTYFIAVDGFAARTGTIALNWNQTPPQTPSRPDALIRGASESASAFSGDNVYNTNGSQSRSAVLKPGNFASFLIRAQNDGTTSEALRITGTPGNNLFRVRYYDVATNKDITTQVVSSVGSTTAVLTPGASRDIKVNIAAEAGTPAGSALAVRVTVASAANATVNDIVQMNISTGAVAAARSLASAVLSTIDADVASASVVLNFSRSLDSSTASNVDNYQVAVNGAVVGVESASYRATSRTVSLALPVGGVQAGDSVTVVWQDLRDAYGNLLSAGTARATAR